ncbi:hypothetical protein K461DRAFT_302260 [Myriangium duriaei CBS 260.36]|uniref:Uncharacterized protein n=1 Tax=Myriangium duriaei CBS 260.36 TaxID=1168546 RepID=A0A9P4MFH7_9PEZI|nr:hypothetical protein K461DRAFT_302260 [Myriangium duriaei CBS 260.36]
MSTYDLTDEQEPSREDVTNAETLEEADEHMLNALQWKGYWELLVTCYPPYIRYQKQKGDAQEQVNESELILKAIELKQKELAKAQEHKSSTQSLIRRQDMQR